MAARKRSSAKARAVEWIAGCASMPAYVTGEGEPYRPELLIWMSADGLVLGCDTGEPGTLLPQAAALLRKTMARPMVGPPHAPTVIRVASPDLVSALRGAAPGVRVVHAPTPELDAVMESMRDGLSHVGSGPTTYLTAGIDEAAVAGFFRAAAAFHRAAPWRIVPPDEALAVSIDELGIHHMAATVVGQHASASGFLVFADVASYRAFVDGPDDELDAPGEMPPHLAVHIGPLHDLPGALAAEATEHGWEIAGPDAVPWPVAIDEDLVPRPMTADELLVSEAFALALAALAASTPNLGRAWCGNDPITRTITVGTHQGPLALTLGAPAEASARSAAGPGSAKGSDVAPSDLVAALGVLEETDEDLDLDRVDALSTQLVAAFRAAPEGRPMPDGPSFAEVLMHVAARHVDATIASVGPEELDEILHALLPRVVLVPSATAGAIIAELRAFYAYLHRAHGLEQAPACLLVLGPEAADRLAAALVGPGTKAPSTTRRS